MTITGPLA
jgi:hypothetical protein